MPDAASTMRSAARRRLIGATRDLVATAMFSGLLAPPNACAQVAMLDIATPRPFGYVIGDVITHDIRLELEAPFTLDENSLPASGRVDVSLERREPVVHSRGRRYDITLRYQLMGRSENEDLAVVIPGFELSVTDGERARPVWIPAWRFDTTALVTARGAELGTLRPRAAYPPPLVTLNPHWGRLAVLLGVLGAAIATLLYVYFARPWLDRRARPFHLALRRLRRLEQAPWNTATQREALRHVHAAFNATAGGAVFASTLDALFAREPHLAPIRGDVEAFYTGSGAIFFDDVPNGHAAGDAVPTLAALIALCRQCRDLERGTA